MANILNNFLKEVVQGDQIKDWDHAAKLFVANNYALAPKNAYLYHVFFDIANTSEKKLSMSSEAKRKELGMMVKQISLPKFTIDTKTLNAYNRPHIVQTKIHYDPITIQFHDDSADVVREFWYDYYDYYYRNSDYDTSGSITSLSNHDEITGDRYYKDWGYTIRGSNANNIVTTPYLNSIRIYSLHNKKFSEYILVNPMIKSFQHGEHNSSETTGLMQHSMTIEYESVVYGYGTVTSNTVLGFADLHYDKRPSPLTPAGGGTASIFGPGGLIESADEIVKDLNNGNIAAALFKGARAGNGLKGANLGALAMTEALSLGRGILSAKSTGMSPMGSIMIPNVGSLVSGIGSLAGKVGSLFSGSSNTQTTDTLPSNIQTGDVRTFGATPQKFTNPFPDNLSINQQGFNSESNSNVV